ncbi:MAG: hypothetical protein Q9160_007317 [Pyrenula sp. 1 TL-2023]
MGFREMPTSQYVESRFWNFDALFVPQQHRARDLQDTFYVSDPKKADKPGAKSSRDRRNYDEYPKNVKRIHENGTFGSIGYKYPCSEDESLRYHEGLHKVIEIGNSGMFRPEMLKSMGLPPDLRVYGFALGLERPSLIKYGISNIRDLLGHQVDLGFIEKNPAVRLDKS